MDTKGALVLVEKNKVYDIAQEGYEKSPEFSENDISILLNNKNAIIFEELPESETKMIMRNAEVLAAIPLRTKGENVGLLLLGVKSSGDIFSDKDIEDLIF